LIITDTRSPYTPLSSADKRGEIDLLVKEYPTGKLSPWLGSLKAGDEVFFKGPMTKIEYQPNTLDRALFIAGGSGVTPAHQLITHALGNKGDKTKFTFLFANIEEQDVLLRKEWEALAAAHPDRLKVVFFLDKAPAGWTGETGYVVADKIEKHFPKKAEGEKVQVFVCGPPGQVAAVSGAKKGREQGPVAGALADLGYTSEEVFKF
jgi:NAD(P)H-flavin reductase